MKNSLTKKFVVVLGLAGAMTACAPQNTNSVATDKGSSIIGGTVVEASDSISKSTVAIIASIIDAQGKEQQFVCTGSLIAENVVLTAGHCVPEVKEGEKAGMYIVFAMDLNKLTRNDIRSVNKVVVHPQYGAETPDGSDTNDISLLRFTGVKPAGYQVAKFLKDETLLTAGATVTLAGYGLTDGVNKTGDNLLRKTDVQIIQNFGKTEVALDQSQGKGACHGDSGGPAFLKGADGVEYVWGITSRGIGKDGKDDCSLFSLYTKVQAHQTFVDGALATLAAPPKAPALPVAPVAAN
jgi:secreted trypsin-like serine protease